MEKTYTFLSRNEYKYFVSPEKYSYLLHDLRKFTVVDGSITDKNEFYQIVSMYFENHQLNSYFDKLDGISKRVKLRLRYYPLSTIKEFNIELKYKIFDKYIKKKAKIDKDILLSLFNKNTAINSATDINDVLSEFLIMKKINNFYPFIRMDYSRLARVGKNDKNVRITFDQSIKCCRFNEDFFKNAHIPVFPLGTTILEIKTNSYFPYWLTYLVKKYSLKRNAISKYVYSVQKLAANSSLSIV